MVTISVVSVRLNSASDSLGGGGPIGKGVGCSGYLEAWQRVAWLQTSAGGMGKADNAQGVSSFQGECASFMASNGLYVTCKVSRIENFLMENFLFGFAWKIQRSGSTRSVFPHSTMDWFPGF